MNIMEYKDKVIDLFKSGKATEKQWNEMATAVLEISESDQAYIVMDIDNKIDPHFLR